MACWKKPGEALPERGAPVLVWGRSGDKDVMIMGEGVEGPDGSPALRSYQPVELIVAWAHMPEGFVREPFTVADSISHAHGLPYQVVDLVIREYERLKAKP